MEFEVDVSGEDIFSKDYTIVIADKNNLVRGFKISERLLRTMRARHGENKYRYSNSRQGKALLAVRLYCIIIYYLFKSVEIKDKIQDVNLTICKDFYGHQKDITSSLKYFLGNLLGLKIKIKYTKLPKGSNADRYAYLMRKDIKNKMEGYIEINLEDIEKYLIKK